MEARSASSLPVSLEEYEVAVSAFYGLQGARLNWEGIPVFPGLGSDYGSVTLLDHAQRSSAPSATGPCSR